VRLTRLDRSHHSIRRFWLTVLSVRIRLMIRGPIRLAEVIMRQVNDVVSIRHGRGLRRRIVREGAERVIRRWGRDHAGQHGLRRTDSPSRRGNAEGIKIHGKGSRAGGNERRHGIIPSPAVRRQRAIGAGLSHVPVLISLCVAWRVVEMVHVVRSRFRRAAAASSPLR
jgi:hypothetical protein